MNFILNLIVLLSIASQIMGHDITNKEISKLYRGASSRNLCLALLPEVMFATCVMRYTGQTAGLLPLHSGINKKCCYNKCSIVNMKLTCDDSIVENRLAAIKETLGLMKSTNSKTPLITISEYQDDEKTEEEKCAAIMDAKKYMRKAEFGQFVNRLVCLSTLGKHITDEE